MINDRADTDLLQCGSGPSDAQVYITNSKLHLIGSSARTESRFEKWANYTSQACFNISVAYCRSYLLFLDTFLVLLGKAVCSRTKKTNVSRTVLWNHFFFSADFIEVFLIFNLLHPAICQTDHFSWTNQFPIGEKNQASSFIFFSLSLNILFDWMSNYRK